ncbi:MAG: heparinase II/III family protein [Candidatus Sumerlaea chitinivorans]|nr:heparinase II/III family protein [Candidatus Sumerlaea chitinivorans]
MKDFKWYYHRLRAMPVGEIPHRLRCAISAARLERFGGPLSRDTIRPEGPPYLALHFSEEEVAPLKEQLVYYQQVRSIALSPRAHVFSLLGAPERDFGTPVNWFCDPVTGDNWPSDVSAFRLNYRHQSRLGEVKYVWELGRMPWLVPWAIAARLTRDGDLARRVVEDILSFVRSNPPYRGVHWTSGIELAVRVVAWTWALALIEPLTSPTDHEWQEIGFHIALYADYCWRFRSLYSSANNHLIAEGVALQVAGLAWPWLPKAAQFAERGRAILDREIPRQIFPDGSSIEMCLSYLCEVLVWSFAAGRVRTQHGLRIPDSWLERWQASANLLLTVCSDNEPLPHLGDDDEGDVLPTGQPIQPHELGQILALLSGKEVEPSAHQIPLLGLVWGPQERVARLCSPPSESVAPLPGTARTPPNVGDTQLFPDCGLVVLRGLKTRVLADFGPHGMPPIYAHAHADALSVTLDIAGYPVLVDPGTYCYHGERVWRDWFRSTAAHNTVEIGQQNQSQMLGPFLWGRVARTRIIENDLAPHQKVCAEHDGYAPLVHRRCIRRLSNKEAQSLLKENVASDIDIEEADAFWVLDTVAPLASARTSEAELLSLARDTILWWHFAPGHIHLASHSVHWRHGSRELTLVWSASEPVIAEIHEGELSPPQGWVSPCFSVKYPAPALGLRIALPQRLPIEFSSLILAWHRAASQ